jgi:hypothetical protein
MEEGKQENGHAVKKEKNHNYHSYSSSVSWRGRHVLLSPLPSYPCQHQRRLCECEDIYNRVERHALPPISTL